MGRESIGEFEQLVLLAVMRLDEEANGMSILDEIKERTGRRVLRPAVYVALRRLEEKGLVAGSAGPSTPARGGRPKKSYRLTAAGLVAVRSARRALMAMWTGFESALDKP